ncbi:hypothetical protein C4K68_12080 [Pokkaliibacter plantistimulans]|uniref:Uncharacterized protein n=1 Tax=Proteobacteria bacterium 228 TaxID=2083153 RepID=A0A2S5KQL6_9PROT|nr:hypothetical protein [Pokkaliibacter plantistimulans]PPC77144.1 hypothetical protein C4K68_12080 [Pokkaliibacter plantistimulans]
MSFLLFVFILLFPVVSYSDSYCSYDEGVYSEFVSALLAKDNGKASYNKSTRRVSVKDSLGEIEVVGDGCDHLGGTINATLKVAILREQDFLKLLLSLTEEYGSWLISTPELKEMIENKAWVKEFDEYVFVFSDFVVMRASFEKKLIKVNFGIN